MNWEQSQNECLKNWVRMSRNGQMWRGGISVKGEAYWQKFYIRNKISRKLKQNVREERRMNWTNRVHSRSKDKDSNYSLWAEGVRLVNRATLVRFRFGSPFSWKLSCDHALTINETLKWLSSLPILTQESFWWRQSSVRYSLPLPPTSWDLGPYLYLFGDNQCNQQQILYSHARWTQNSKRLLRKDSELRQSPIVTICYANKL